MKQNVVFLKSKLVEILYQRLINFLQTLSQKAFLNFYLVFHWQALSWVDILKHVFHEL